MKINNTVYSYSLNDIKMHADLLAKQVSNGRILRSQQGQWIDRPASNHLVITPPKWTHQAMNFRSIRADRRVQ